MSFSDTSPFTIAIDRRNTAEHAARDTAVIGHSRAIITLKAVLVTASDELRVSLEPLTSHKLVLACAELDTAGDISDPEVAMRNTLACLALRWLALHEEIKIHTARLKSLTQAAAPELLNRFGIGFDSAAEMLVTAGDNTDRIYSEAAFAKLCGACPIPAGSGKTSGRHRLNRGGNRQANAALYRIVIVRMRWHPPILIGLVTTGEARPVTETRPSNARTDPQHGTVQRSVQHTVQ